MTDLPNYTGPPSIQEIEEEGLPNSNTLQPYTPEAAKELIESATLNAISTFQGILDNEDATDAAKVRAALAILELGHGKNTQAFNIKPEEENKAKMIARSIQNARRPHQTPDSEVTD